VGGVGWVLGQMLGGSVAVALDGMVCLSDADIGRQKSSRGEPCRKRGQNAWHWRKRRVWMDRQARLAAEARSESSGRDNWPSTCVW
jgi:hypothetical protein